VDQAHHGGSCSTRWSQACPDGLTLVLVDHARPDGLRLAGCVVGDNRPPLGLHPPRVFDLGGCLAD
jgi:hypothetical protein